MIKDYSYEFEYDARYCYPETNVLKNKLNISDSDVFEEAERQITAIRTAEATLKGIKGKFDYSHLKKIHKFIFGDIFDWAGKSRLVNISKGNQFCRSEFIDQQMDEIFLKLKEDNYLANIKSRKELVEKLTYYLSEINAIHPFREGNGRTQRMFMQLLCDSLGYQLDFSDITAEEMLEASVTSFDLDYGLMNEIIEKSLKKK